MTTERPFRFGVQLFKAESAAHWADQVRRLESLGYDTLVTPDHFSGHVAWAPALTAAAYISPTLRLCPFVLDNDFRHPGLVAFEAATLDLLSEGRLDLGLGAGWNGDDYRRSGIPFDPPGVRVSRLEESLRIIKGMFAGGPVTQKGRYYQVEDLPGYPEPVQKPHPPFVIGGGGKRMLSIAAREAEIVGLIGKANPDGSGLDPLDTTAEATERKVGWVREAAGDRFDRLTLNVLVSRALVTEDTAEARAMKEEVANRWGADLATIEETPYVLVGSKEEVVEKVLEARARWGISYFVFAERNMETFAPVVAELRGR